MAPALPAVAVLVAGASAVRRRRARVALATIAVIVLTYQTLTHITDITPSFMSETRSRSAGPYVAVIQLESQPIGYEKLPGDDYGNPVIEYIEEVARVEPGGLAMPRSVCLLESEAVINSNTFGFLARAREDPFVFSDIVLGPEGQKGLRSGASHLQLRPLCQAAEGSSEPRRGKPPGNGQRPLRGKPHDAAAVRPLPRPQSNLSDRPNPGGR